MDTEPQISIVGAGLLGSALALYLAKYTDYKIAIIERAKPLNKPQGANQRVLALGEVAANFLSDICIFDVLDKSSCHPYSGMCVWDENSTGQLNFSADEYGKEQLGWMVDSQLLTYKLQQKLLQTSSIECHFSCQLESLTWRKQKAANISKLSFIDGNDEAASLQSQLLIAADGGRSWLRRQAKIFSNQFSYNQSALSLIHI